jgi:hypothetical protein
VYDFGAGTLDVSFVKMQRLKFRVVAVSGDTQLGGRDFDNRLSSVMIAEWDTAHPMPDGEKKERAHQHIREACEETKIALSSSESYELSVEFDDPKWNIARLWTRREFEKLTIDLFNRALLPVDTVLKQAGVRRGEIDELILVGGSSHMPKVRQMLEQATGKTAYQGVDPQEAVAMGACIIAAKMKINEAVDDVADASVQSGQKSANPRTQSPNEQFLAGMTVEDEGGIGRLGPTAIASDRESSSTSRADPRIVPIAIAKLEVRLDTLPAFLERATHELGPATRELVPNEKFSQFLRQFSLTDEEEMALVEKYRSSRNPTEIHRDSFLLEVREIARLKTLEPYGENIVKRGMKLKQEFQREDPHKTKTVDSAVFKRGLWAIGIHGNEADLLSKEYEETPPRGLFGKSTCKYSTFLDDIESLPMVERAREIDKLGKLCAKLKPLPATFHCGTEVLMTESEFTKAIRSVYTRLTREEWRVVKSACKEEGYISWQTFLAAVGVRHRRATQTD